MVIWFKIRLSTFLTLFIIKGLMFASGKIFQWFFSPFLMLSLTSEKKKKKRKEIGILV